MTETFNRTSAALATTNITDVYQAPNSADADRAIVLSCLIANVDGVTAADITVTIANSANTAISSICSAVTVPAKASLEIVANKLVLKRGEKIRATASSANDLEVTVSTLEITV